MKTYEADHAQLFTPGRSSYLAPGEQPGTYSLLLSESSQRRADEAAIRYIPGFHTNVLFAGGYPGVAEQWPAEQTPPADQREAYLMAEPLKSRLRTEGLDYTAINSLVKTQGDSNNSIGDVAVSMERGLLKIDDFHRPKDLYALDLIAGKLHGMRFGLILRAALDLAPGQLRRAPIHDVYSKPATPFRKAEAAPIGIAREMVAIGLTKVVLRDVQPGNVASLLEAEERFNKLAAKGAKKS